MIQTQATVVDIQHSPNKQVAFIYFKPDDIFVFQEGQFIFLERLSFSYPDGKVMKNAYSIATTNAMLQQKGVIGTIVKKSAEGGMSDYLTQHITIGDTIKMTGPLGHFFDKKKSRNYAFVSIGSGITPLFALYTSLLQTAAFDRIINVFGERYEQNILPTVMQAYTTQDPRITQMLYLSQEPMLPQGRQAGHVQQAVQTIIETFADNDCQIFLCGKPAMVDDIVKKLCDAGIQKECISFEKY